MLLNKNNLTPFINFIIFMAKYKSCIIFILVSIFPSVISAQNFSKWTVGVELGINFSDSSEDTAPLKKERPILPMIGITLDYNLLHNNIYIQSGITYSMKGLRSNGKTEHLEASVKLHQQVIQIPVLLNYKFKYNKFKIGPGIGIYYAHGIGGKTKAVGQVNGENINIEKNTFGNILKHQDFGLEFKLCSQFELYQLNLSYEHGFRNIGKSNVMGAPLDYKNRVLSISIGYLF